MVSLKLFRCELFSTRRKKLKGSQFQSQVPPPPHYSLHFIIAPYTKKTFKSQVMSLCNCSRSALGGQSLLYSGSVATIPGRLASTTTTGSALSLASAQTPRGGAALAAAGGGGWGNALAAPTPPVQVQLFESAAYTCYPTFSVVPYGFGPAVSVMTPTYGGGGTWDAYGQYTGGNSGTYTPPRGGSVVPVPAPDSEAQILASVGGAGNVGVDGGGQQYDDGDEYYTDDDEEEPYPEEVPIPLPEPGGSYLPVPFTPAPEFTANSCGCCRTPFSVMSPAGFQAWRPLIEQVNAPYAALLGCRFGGGGGGCGGGGGF